MRVVFNICKVCLTGLGPAAAALAGPCSREVAVGAPCPAGTRGCAPPPQHHTAAGAVPWADPRAPGATGQGGVVQSPSPPATALQQAAGRGGTAWDAPQTCPTVGSSCRATPVPHSISHARETEELLTNVNGSRNHAGSSAGGSHGVPSSGPGPMYIVYIIQYVYF